MDASLQVQGSIHDGILIIQFWTGVQKTGYISDLSPDEILDAGLFPAPVWRAKITSSDQELHIRILRDNSPGVFFLQYKENRNKFQINRSSGFH